MTDPTHLDEEKTERLATALTACPELRATAEHVREFADLMNKRHGERLTDWIAHVQADPLPALHSLVTGLRRDLDAVIAGLTMPWNSGPVEGVRRQQNQNHQKIDVRPSQLLLATQENPTQRVSLIETHRRAAPQDPDRTESDDR